MRRSFIRALLLPVLLAAFSSAQAYENQDVIDYRQHVMKTLDEQTAALGMIMSTQVSNENLVAHLDAIAFTAKTALKSFEPKVPGGESLPVVWEKWADFSQRMNDFSAKATHLAETGRKRSQEEVLTEMIDALSCKSCHDIYRGKK